MSRVKKSLPPTLVREPTKRNGVIFPKNGRRDKRNDANPTKIYVEAVEIPTKKGGGERDFAKCYQRS